MWSTADWLWAWSPNVTRCFWAESPYVIQCLWVLSPYVIQCLWVSSPYVIQCLRALSSYDAIPLSIVSIMSPGQYKISRSQNFEIPNVCHRNWEKGRHPGSLRCVRTYVKHSRTVDVRISKNHDRSVAERISKIGSPTVRLGFRIRSGLVRSQTDK